MADIKISQLTAKGSAIANTDLVEISQSDGAGGYITKSVTGANIIGSKQDTLISGTNIKTINSTTLLGSGNLAVQPTLVSGTNIKTINSNSILGSGDLVITGGVSSVSATTPVVATGTTTPVISLASNYGDTLNPYASKTANNILAAPNGSSGVPTFRAIVGADIPTLNQNTTGTASNVTGIVAVANGGTGTATPSLVAGTNITVTGTFPNQTITASGAAGAVTQIVAGTNVTISPAGGTGIVTVNASGGGGGGGFHMLSPTLPGILYLAQAYQTNYGTTTLSNGVNFMMMTLFAPATTFTITELSVNVTTAASSASNVKILVYSDDGFGYPRAKLIESSALSMTTTGAKTFLTSYTFTAGTRYWMGVITDSSAGANVTGLGNSILYMRHFNYNVSLSGYYISADFSNPPLLNTDATIGGNLQTAAVFVRT